MSSQLDQIIDIPRQFVKESTQFVNRCTKPTQKEFLGICRAVGIGFAIMGFIGFFVKLIHIPVNHVLLPN